MGIKGFQGTSLLDYPGRIASLVFYGGCNLTCPFCHNGSLILTPEDHPDYPADILLHEIEERRNFIDGVVISGGEPTLDPELPAFLARIRKLDLQIKLDTNGLAPAVLEQLMNESLVDYVALDLKTAPERYNELHRAPVDLGLLPQSIELLRKGTIDYEFRTTCVPGLIEEPDLHQLGKLLHGAPLWILQQFVPEHALALDWRKCSAHSAATLRHFEEIASRYAAQVSLRGL
ncbi:MAG: anaerobic ribonucleoside-triphosphate reductase activating protein [Geoalkalibacter sp.]|jgi:pyruvate formate lyase activating enzyme|uniref:anaerobic ribonucleoside-triphosphate reductase activating protein n=1 Tax=Geoalkalibacter sp. TaxID=3041440 RepID=UPI002A9EB98C|nr:anaerobic ribonucleoside-triphosphate reductase activating protein [Thermodesulfobacteriota bacterium]